MLWFGHIVITWLYFRRWTIWSVAPDIPMMLLLAPTGVPWSVQKEWLMYSLLYKIPHSLCVILLIPKPYRSVYMFHILCDVLSHTGEWSIEPFFPLSSLKIHGIWDPVQWK